MMSLFNSFDFFLFATSFVSLFFIVFLYFTMFWKNSMNFHLSGKLNLLLFNFFFSLKEKKYDKFSIVLILMLFMLILICNFASLFPFMFPFCSQLSIMFFVAITFWMTFLIFSLFNNSKYLISHFVPEGTPLFLVPLLFLIELVSNIIRPITLTVRICANILAGHLLIILLSGLIFFKPLIFPLILFLGSVELAVGIIQAYIFCTMICLYFSEVN